MIRLIDFRRGEVVSLRCERQFMGTIPTPPHADEAFLDFTWNLPFKFDVNVYPTYDGTDKCHLEFLFYPKQCHYLGHGLVPRTLRQLKPERYF